METLIQYFNSHLSEGICIAFSGGVDSSLLLKAACLAYETCEQQAQTDGFPPTSRPPVRRPLAVTFQTRLHPHGDLEAAKTMAEQFGAAFLCLEADELAEAGIGENPPDRCYLCKRLLFTKLSACASENGCGFVADGTNYDDRNAYRPGMRALKELGIRSPLLELAITKAEIRSLAAEAGIPSANRPSAPCLATRIPYGTRLDYDLLARIDAGEDWIRSLGFYNVRIRIHGDVARIEVDQKEFGKFLSCRESIVNRLKELGFIYLTLDLEGFRSGSMDVTVHGHCPARGFA